MKSYEIVYGGATLVVQLEDSTAQALGLSPISTRELDAPKISAKQATAPANKALKVADK